MKHSKLAIFDMDQTLFHETLYKGVEQILERFKTENYSMAVASYNPCAKWLCDRYDITDYFDIVCGYYSPKGKMTHIQEIFSFYEKNNIKVSESSTFFYDDNENNISEIKNNTKIHCVKINAGGIKMSDITSCLGPQKCMDAPVVFQASPRGTPR